MPRRLSVSLTQSAQRKSPTSALFGSASSRSVQQAGKKACRAIQPSVKCRAVRHGLAQFHSFQLGRGTTVSTAPSDRYALGPLNRRCITLARSPYTSGRNAVFCGFFTNCAILLAHNEG